MIAVDGFDNEYTLTKDDDLYIDENETLWLQLYGELIEIEYIKPDKHGMKNKYDGYNI